MAKKSKYTYYPTATVKDELDGSVYTLGSTIESMSIEISGNTHPFYTGQETLVDTAGRIDKFKSRMAAATGSNKTKKERKSSKRQKSSLASMLKEEPMKADKKTGKKLENNDNIESESNTKTDQSTSSEK